MKKYLFTLLSMLFVFTSMTYAETVTIDFYAQHDELWPDMGYSSANSNEGDFTETTTATLGDISVTVTPSTTESPNRLWKNSACLRLYSGSLTISVPAGCQMSSIVFTYSKWGEGVGNTVNVGELDNATATWTGTAEAVEFSIAATTTLKTMTVTYENLSAVPANEKYTELEYIQCTGGEIANAFITNYNPSTPTVVKVGFQQTGSYGWMGIFSARNVGAGTGISLYVNGNNVNLGYFTGSTRAAGDTFVDDYENGARYDVEAHTTYLKWKKEGGEWNEKATGNSEMNETSRNIAIFANPEYDYAFRGKIFYLDIEEMVEGEDNVVVHQYKPVMRHDGVWGYLDAVTGELMTPALGNYDNYVYATKDGQSVVTLDKTYVGVKPGQTETVTVSGATNYTWTSSDEAVATVEDGVIRGVGEGECVVKCITSENGGWELSVNVEVIGTVHFTVWNGTDDAILPSIKYSGNDARWAYTAEFASDEGYGSPSSVDNPNYNKIWGTPAVDTESNEWFAENYDLETTATVWSYNNTVLPNSWSGNPGEVYVRRYFTANGDLSENNVYMPAPHDDAPCEYYINGVLVWSRTGWEPDVNGWNESEIVLLTDEQKALIKTDGSINVFAYHVHQNWGGRYADGGLYIAGTPANDFNSDGNRLRLMDAIAQFEAEGLEVPAGAREVLNWRQDAGRYLNIMRYIKRLATDRRDYSKVESAEPADGMTCWLYNVGAEKFLAGGNDWGTHASLTPQMNAWPMVLLANETGENRFTIQTNLPNGTRGVNDALGHNGYVDCGYLNTTEEKWAWEFEAVGDGTYRIINSENGKYLGMTEDRRLQVDTDKEGADNTYNHWKVISKAMLDAMLDDAATYNPVDMTYMIHQNAFCQNDFDGNSKGDATNELNDSKWERNAGSIWNWKGNNADGDYVFEAWNVEGEIYLKQTIEGLRPGRYVVSCNGYYRDGDYESARAGNDAQLAYLYAGSQENAVALPSILEGAGKGVGYGSGSIYSLIPNSCVDAAHFFQLGAYNVQVPAVVGEDGTLEIGVFRGAEDVKEGDWVVVDNFRLNYLGEEKLYIRNPNKWNGLEMTLADDSNDATRHFTWTGYLGMNELDGFCFNFTLNEGHKDGECWGPAETRTIAEGEEAEIANYGDKVFSYVGKTGYVTVHAYMTANGNSIVVEDNTVEALKDVEKMYIVGENTTDWSRKSEDCPSLDKVAEGVYEGVVKIKRDNAVYDAIRLATVADNGDNDGYVGFSYETSLGNATYNLQTSKYSRCYMRKGDVKITVDFNEGTVTTEYVNVEPAFFYAVGTLVDVSWNPENTTYKLEETATGSCVWQGKVNVAESSDDHPSRFSLYEERASGLWWNHVGRRGPVENLAPVEQNEWLEGVATGHDSAWTVPAGEWLVTLDLNTNAFMYQDPATVGLSVVENETNVEGIYNIAGQKVNKAVKGLYIVNGKKVVVK